MNATKDEFLQIRLTAEQKESIRISAKTANADMSSWILSIVANNQSSEFSKLFKKLTDQKQQSYVYAEIHDFLGKLHSSNFTLAVQSLPDVNLIGFQINYVAAMVEHRAFQLSEPIPEWCALVTKLKRPYFGSQLKSLKLHLLLNSPLAFRRRNIFIDSSIGDRV